MYRLCFGTIMTILYQARSHKVTNKSICNALFSYIGKTVESYDSSTPGHLKSGKINVPPDVIDAARKTKHFWRTSILYIFIVGVCNLLCLYRSEKQ